MNASKNLKSTLAAAAVALSLVAPAAQAESTIRDTGIGAVIAAQGNAALQEIRTELLIAHVLATRPPVPVRPRPAARTAVAQPRPKSTKVGA